MTLSERKAKIRWQCRRGMLELDLLLNQFLTEHLESLSEDQLRSLEVLLVIEDPILYAYLIEGFEPANSDLIDIVKLISLPH